MSPKSQLRVARTTQGEFAALWLGTFLLALVLTVMGWSVAWGGSLWPADGRGFLFTDLKARRVGDLVTIQVTETSTSNREAETKVSKDDKNEADFRTLFGINTNRGGRERGRFNFSGKNDFDGKGTITRSDRVTAQIVARVVKVLENGTLLVEGRRAIAVNDETQLLTISGLLRPADISPENTAPSTALADVEIGLVGKGIIADKQSPGILNQIFDFFRIF
jgi:flagellar L-ring protein precursor FlgH